MAGDSASESKDCGISRAMASDQILMSHTQLQLTHGTVSTLPGLLLTFSLLTLALLGEILKIPILRLYPSDMIYSL